MKDVITYGIALLLLLFCRAMPKKILIFGGNGFMGAQTSIQLIKSGHNLTLLSRGTWQWDTSQTVRPFVRHIRCDRYKPEDIESVKSQLSDEMFDIVLDFSAYKPAAVEPFFEWLKDHTTGFYLYISSDSVYEVCIPASGPSEEEDSLRPKSIDDQRKLNRLDSYGHKKLSVEEFVQSHSTKNSLPYVFLRLPDVLGPMDGTSRWWRYQLWLKYADVLGVPVPVPRPVQKLRTSYVSSSDVALLIKYMVEADDASAFHRQIFNIGFPEPKLLRELLADIAFALGLQQSDAVIKETEDTDGTFFFPSVTRGPVNVAKAQTVLNWAPATDWSSFIKQTVEFYEDAFHKFPSEKDNVIADLIDDLKPNLSHEGEQKFQSAIDEQLDNPVPKRHKTEL